MPAEGHAIVTNMSVSESAPLGVRAGRRKTNKISLPYYKAPRIPPRLELESAPGMEEPEVAAVDVAVASFGNPLVLEAIIGNDDRVKVDRTALSQNPWRQICSLRITSQSNQVYVGTGWYIAPKVLATAGHCVFLQD